MNVLLSFIEALDVTEKIDCFLSVAEAPPSLPLVLGIEIILDPFEDPVEVIEVIVLVIGGRAVGAVSGGFFPRPCCIWNLPEENRLGC